jgi:hypothetical protein
MTNKKAKTTMSYINGIKMSINDINDYISVSKYMRVALYRVLNKETKDKIIKYYEKSFEEPKCNIEFPKMPPQINRKQRKIIRR